MDDRKRHADADDSAAPPAKRHASAANGDDGPDVKFGPLQSPWQVDLESFQKDAIFRQMKEYKREKNVLEQQLAEVEKRAKDFDDRLIHIDTWLDTIADELSVVIGRFTPSDNHTRSQADAAYLSQLLKSDNKIFKDLTDARFSRLKEIFTSIISHVPQASPEVRELQIEIARVLASEKEYKFRAEGLQIKQKDLETKCEDFQYKWSMAKAQLAKAQSKASQYMEQQNRRKSSTDDTQAISKQANGEVNGVAKVEGNGIINEEAESAKRAAFAEVEKRTQQVAELEAEIKKLNERLTANSSRLDNLSDEDYAQTQLFKTLKSQHEDVVKRINDLEARNIQYREEVQKLTGERSAYRNQVDEECRAKLEEAEAAVAKVDLDVQRIRSERDLIHQQKAIIEGNQTKHDIAMKQLQDLQLATEKQNEALQLEVDRLKLALSGHPSRALESTDVTDLSDEALRAEVSKLRTERTALNIELESMQAAVQKFKATATKKVSEVLAMDQEIARLKEAKYRLDSSRFNEKTTMDARKAECESMRKQNQKSGEMVTQIRDSENKIRELCANLEKQNAEYRASNELLTDQNGVKDRKIESLTNATTTHETQMTTWKAALAAKDADLAACLHDKRTIDAEFASLKSKFSDARKRIDERKSKNKSDSTDEVQMLRSVAYCNTCNSNLKDTLIRSCGHILCKPCVDSRLANRQRKCPVCMKAFGAGDIQTVHLV